MQGCKLDLANAAKALALPAGLGMWLKDWQCQPHVTIGLLNNLLIA